MEKYCTKCHTYKGLDDFGFNKNNHDGRQNQCRSCAKKQKQEYNKAIQESNTDERIAEIERENPLKLCQSCKVEKRIVEFDVRKSSLDAHESYCRDCHGEEHKEKFHAHKELSNEEYEEERKKDGHFTTSEFKYLEQVMPYCKSPETASLFSKEWQ